MKSTFAVLPILIALIIGCQASLNAPAGLRPQPTAATSPRSSPATSAPLARFSGDFSRWLSGDVRDESLGWLGDPDRYRISFRPVAGIKQHWYYRWALPRPLDLAPDDTLVLEVRLRTTVEGPANPLTEIRLCGSYNVLDDAGVRRQQDSVTLFHTAFIHAGWQSLVSRPIRPALDVAGRLVLTGIFAGVLNPNREQRLELEIASLVLRRATAAEVAAASQPPEILRGRTVRSFPLENDFRFGAWGNLWAGDDPWHAYLDAVPRRERELCNLENALEAGLDTLWTPGIHHPALGTGKRDTIGVDEALRLVRLAAGHGLASIAMTYLSQYYAPTVQLADCARAVRETVARLSTEPGVLAYYAIDEPKPDDRTLATWLWTKDVFAEADPTRPVLGCLNTPACIRAYAGTDHSPLLDIYPLSGGLLATTGGDPLELARCIDLAREHGSTAPWVVPQAFTLSFNAASLGCRPPSPAELRLMTWTSLAHGARGVLWFALHGEGLCHGLDDQGGVVGIFGAGYSPIPGFGAEAVALGQRIPLLGPALLGTRRDPAAEHLLGQSGAVQAVWLGGPIWDALVLCNHDLAAVQTADLAIPEVLRRGRGILRLATGERLGSRIALELAPGDGELLVVADATGLAEAQAGIDRRRANVLLRRLRFRAAEAQANRIAVPAVIRAGGDLAALAEAGRVLEAACTADPVFQPAQAALRRIQSAVTDAGWRMNQRVAATYPRFDASAIAAMRAWNRQLTRCQGVFVLLRNALYAGRAVEIGPLAARGTVFAEEFQAKAAAGTFALVEAEALESLYRDCLELRRP